MLCSGRLTGRVQVVQRDFMSADCKGMRVVKVGGGGVWRRYIVWREVVGNFQDGVEKCRWNM